MRAFAPVLLAAGLCLGTPAMATPVFEAPAISDVELSAQHGRAAPSTFAQLRGVMTDTAARDFFRVTADINQTTFDNWFANEGAILIVNNLVAVR